MGIKYPANMLSFNPIKAKKFDKIYYAYGNIRLNAIIGKHIKLDE